MSLSRPKAVNPAERSMQWRGGEDGGGRITYYDKDAEEEIEVDLPFSFIVLEGDLSTITGFSEKDQSGFWSNEVRDLGKQVLTVHTRNGVVAKGLYEDIKDEIKAKGAKFTKSVYVAFKGDDGELHIGHLKLSGSSLTPWIDFTKKYDLEKCAVVITDKPKKGKKGSTTYFMPVFMGQKLGDATRLSAVPLDETIQNYLDAYFARKPDTEEVTQYATSADDLATSPTKKPDADDVDIEDVDDDDIAEEVRPKKTVAKKKAKPAPVEEDDDEDEDSIPIQDVPF